MTASTMKRTTDGVGYWLDLETASHWIIENPKSILSAIKRGALKEGIHWRTGADGLEIRCCDIPGHTKTSEVLSQSRITGDNK